MVWKNFWIIQEFDVLYSDFDEYGREDAAVSGSHFRCADTVRDTCERTVLTGDDTLTNLDMPVTITHVPQTPMLVFVSIGIDNAGLFNLNLPVRGDRTQKRLLAPVHVEHGLSLRGKPRDTVS